MFGRPRGGAVRRAVGVVMSGIVLSGVSFASGPGERMRLDSQAGKPLVAHVVVALCDNAHQGIVPVPRALGDGQDAGLNLYWGARFGLREYFRRAPGWKKVRIGESSRSGVLERVAFRSTVGAGELTLVADAWDGSRIQETVRTFLEMASGRARETVEVEGRLLAAGGSAHVVAFVGHNGLMDFAAPRLELGSGQPGRSAVVLACASKPYFESLLERAGAYPLLLTTGLMAPEAYSLEASVRTWFTTADAAATRRAAADAYQAYQHCGLRAAKRLFSVEQ
jgi:hypothetical protein